MSDERTNEGPDVFSSKVESVESKSEYSVVDYQDYRDLCDYGNDGSRRRGILSEELYREIVDDTSTGCINIGGSLVPALIDISYGLAMGYDSSRCKMLAADLSTNIKVLSIPVHELNDDERQQLAELLQSDGGCALYFSDHNDDELKALGDILEIGGIDHAEKALVDSRAKKGDEQAALYLYSCYAEQNHERGQPKRLRLSDVQDYYDKNMEPSYTADGDAVTTINMGDRISDQEAEEMWRIYDEMFSFLGGEDHPISMQDTKEDFFKMLRQDCTMIAVTHRVVENGPNELTCFTYFIDDMDTLYWLNKDFINNNSGNYPDYVTDIFTPGLVSNGTGRSYAPLSIGFFARVADEAGLSANVTYENTNLSKRYVPRIVDRSMGSACRYTTITPSKLIDVETYRLWAIGDVGE